MQEGPNISSIAALIGDPARANMLMALLRVPALSAGELAAAANVTAQTASGHLRQLCEAGLMCVIPQGRHRYYRLADERVGQVLEQMLGLAAHLGHMRTRPGPKDPALRRARTCYDHMAGEIAVGLFERMSGLGFFISSGDALALTPAGHDAFQAAGVPAEALREIGRPLCRACLDWSERRPHLAGRAGAALLQLAQQKLWVKRDRRFLEVTPRGDQAFRTLFLSAGPA